MKCERIRELVSDALDGALAGSVADRFHAHLDACPPCRSYHAELKESLLLLEELPVVEVGEEFDRAVWARIPAEEEPSSLWAAVVERMEMLRVRFSAGTGLLRWSPALGAAALLLGIVVNVPSPFETSPFQASSAQNGTASPSGLAATSGEEATAETRSSREPLPGMEVAVNVIPVDRRENVAVDEPADYPSGMPNAVAHFVSEGRDLRLANTESYERSNYNYPLRHIPDPFAGSPGASVLVRSPRRAAPVSGHSVGATVPTGPRSDAAVAVFEF